MLDPERLETALTFDDVLLVPAHSTVLPSQTDVGVILARGIRLAVPILSSAMDTVTEAQTAIALARAGGLGVIHKNLSPEEQARQVAAVKAAPGGARGSLLVGAALGVGPDRAARLEALLAAGCDVVVIDTAHGHSQVVLDVVAEVRRAHPTLVLAAGNVATAEGCAALARAGADVVKVGVGPGSICTTRVVTGVGVPQLSAIAACAGAAREHGVTIVADGGIVESGDVAKALAAGAHAVMIGSLFAGADEAPGEDVERDGRRYKRYRGMGSLGAMADGSRDRYFQSEAVKLVPEGIEGLVGRKGPLAEVVFQLVGGLRSAMGYTGCASLEELRTRSRFVRVTPAGRRESHPHDLAATSDAPNYRSK
jgi:IMP dehydrogenase